MAPSLRSHFADYAGFHRSAGNQACHAIGIPLIVLTLLALLARLPLLAVGGVTLTAAEALVAAATLYYLALDLPLALAMLGISAGLAALGRLLPAGVALALFAFGWLLQFLGHYVYEKKSPAFYGNLRHLLIGPLWILAKAAGRAEAGASRPAPR